MKISALLFLSLFTLLSCTKKTDTAPSGEATAQKVGKEYIVGTDAAYTPFESETAEKDCGWL